jgi:uncharacterized membrane protein YcaP (DUF421 family)
MIKKALAKELLSRAELLTVLHRQGFDGLHEVERCVLEPGGTFFVQRKTPADEDIRHKQVLTRLETLEAKLDLLLEKQ